MSPNPIKVLEDRIEFKFYAAEKYLKDLKELDAKGMTPRYPSGRIEWEMIMENILFHLVGALDALLRRIQKKFQLKIKNPRDFTIKKTYKELKSRQNLLKEAYDLIDRNLYPEGSWLSDLFKIRNIGMHRSIINLSFTAAGENFAVVGVRDSGEGIIIYLENSIQQMKQLITKIIEKDPLLSDD
jgi:Cthe_2314-like HEPN